MFWKFGFSHPFLKVAVYRGDIMPEDASDDISEPLRMNRSFRMEVIDC
jgi:hypothetical protein